MQNEEWQLVNLAVAGDKGALQRLLAGVEDSHQSHDTAFDLSQRECVFHLGLPHCHQLPDQLQKVYVCTAPAEF